MIDLCGLYLVDKVFQVLDLILDDLFLQLARALRRRKKQEELVDEGQRQQVSDNGILPVLLADREAPDAVEVRHQQGKEEGPAHARIYRKVVLEP